MSNMSMSSETVTPTVNPVTAPVVKHVLTVAERNARFKKMGKMRRRVAIAKDVIAQLDDKSYLAEHGTYLRSNYGGSSCTVCALGAIFASDSMVTTGGKPKNTYLDGEGMRAALATYFDETTLMKVEAAFERWTEFPLATRDANGDRNLLNTYDSFSFGAKYDKDDDRMRAIMANIIKNKGEFKPEAV